MAIEIITGTRRIRSFLVYDFEWIPGTMQVRVCGVFDGQEYRHYPTVEAFLDGELTHENRGRWFYAHAGGLADIQFVIQAIKKRPEFEVQASFSGSSAIIVSIRRGGHKWTFIDSFWLLRAPLAKVAKMIGMEKGGPKGMDEDTDDLKIKEWYATVPRVELVAYNRMDCEILWYAIKEFEKRLLDLGGELMMTLASCAMRLFRREYLTEGIETHGAINQYAVEAYFASRVEVFDHRPIERAWYYDINSSFPYAMTFPCPGALKSICKWLPDDDSLYIAKVEVSVPDCHLPTLPVRMGERVFFPTGRFTGRYCGTDIEQLIAYGGKIEKVYEVMTFHPFDDLKAYALDLYEKRRVTSDEVEKVVYKLLLNSLYGKFAEMVEKLKVHVNPSLATLDRLSFDDMIMPGVFFEEVEAKVNHRHVPIAVQITARARKTITDCMAQAGEGRFHYCDTDGFSTTKRFPTSDALGRLKLEDEIKKGDEPWRFVQPKLYRKGDVVKAKGFSLGKNKKKAIRSFEQLLEGKEVQVERMVRLRENMRKGILDPREMLITKKLSQNVIPKRFKLPDGRTRPWTIEELNARIKTNTRKLFC